MYDTRTEVRATWRLFKPPVILAAGSENKWHPDWLKHSPHLAQRFWNVHTVCSIICIYHAQKFCNVHTVCSKNGWLSRFCYTKYEQCQSRQQLQLVGIFGGCIIGSNTTRRTSFSAENRRWIWLGLSKSVGIGGKGVELGETAIKASGCNYMPSREYFIANNSDMNTLARQKNEYIVHRRWT